MKHKRLLFALLLFPVTTLTAQHTKIDSLKKSLSQIQRDTDKINTLLHLGTELENFNPDSAILVGSQALNLSRRITWGKGIISAQYSLGIWYSIKGNGANALASEDSALANSGKYNYSGKVGSIYNALGNIVSDQNNYSDGLKYYFKALSADSINGENNRNGVYNNIGVNYQEMGEYVKAEQYYIKAEKIDEEKNNKENLASIYGNLGNLYYLQGNFQKGIESNLKALELDSSINAQERLISDYQNTGLGYLYLNRSAIAMAYGFKSMSLSQKLGISAGIQKCFYNIGQEFQDIYEADSLSNGYSYTRNGVEIHVAHTALLDSAFDYFKSCVKYADSSQDKLSLLMGTKGMGEIYALRKDYPRAIANYQYAYHIADSVGVMHEKMEISLVLGHALAKTGNYPLAIKYLNNGIALKDTLFGKEKSRQMAEMEAKYQNEKKEKEIEALAQRNKIQKLEIRQSRYFIYGLASLILLIAALSFLLIRQNRINAVNSKIELEQKLLRSQMNPHFIFNAMTSVQNYIYKEKPEVAANYLSSMFKLMRAIIEGSKEEYILLEKEIAALNHYLALQQLCFQNKFDFRIDIDSGIDTENTIIPPMMAQPFIENAIEHGIMNKDDGKGIISIRLGLKNDMLSFEIQDNGVGREKAKKLNKEKTERHLSVATQITNERIDLLNKKSKKKITLQVTDLRDEKGGDMGMLVTFNFPMNKMA